MVPQSRGAGLRPSEECGGNADWGSGVGSLAKLGRQGPPVTSILAEADKVRADFIIMGSHGHGRLYDLFVGSTASGAGTVTR